MTRVDIANIIMSISCVAIVKVSVTVEGYITDLRAGTAVTAAP